LRWAGYAGPHHYLLQILKVVMAFTVGHSITLALAGLGLVRVPGRPIEFLMCFDRLRSSRHARGIAAFFGLVHALCMVWDSPRLSVEL